MLNILRLFLFLIFCFVCLKSDAQAKIKVVASLSTFADLAQTIGGDEVEVSYIAPPRFNPHFIEPKPSDVLKVKRCDLFMHAGLDLELWRYPLVDATGNADVRPGGSRELDLSRGIQLLEVPTTALTRASGDIHIYGNPHYWIHPENAKVIAKSICDKLSEIDPMHESQYRRNLESFLKSLDEKISQWRAQLESFKGQGVIVYHNEWPYFMSFSGLRSAAFLEPKPGIPPTPKQIGFVEKTIREQGIRVIINADYFPKTAVSLVAKTTGARVVLLCQNVGERAEAKDYVSMMDYNVNALVAALSEK